MGGEPKQDGEHLEDGVGISRVMMELIVTLTPVQDQEHFQQPTSVGVEPEQEYHAQKPLEPPVNNEGTADRAGRGADGASLQQVMCCADYKMSVDMQTTTTCTHDVHPELSQPSTTPQVGEEKEPDECLDLSLNASTPPVGGRLEPDKPRNMHHQQQQHQGRPATLRKLLIGLGWGLMEPPSGRYFAQSCNHHLQCHLWERSWNQRYT